MFAGLALTQSRAPIEKTEKHKIRAESIAYFSFMFRYAPGANQLRARSSLIPLSTSVFVDERKYGHMGEVSPSICALTPLPLPLLDFCFFAYLIRTINTASYVFSWVNVIVLDDANVNVTQYKFSLCCILCHTLFPFIV